MSSSAMRGSRRGSGEANYNGIVRRMVGLPRSILGGFSRVMDQGMDLMGIGGRRNRQNHQPNFTYQYPMNYPLQDPFNFPVQYAEQQPQMNVHDEWAFLAKYEQQYGTTHPFFYACRFMDALKMAQNEHKFMFMYLHSPEHPCTPSFCRETLSSELVVQFLDANFVSWGALAIQGEGLQMATTLKASTFPFCAVVALGSGDNLAVLRQIEGPMSPAELVELLQRTLEEQGLAFGSNRLKEEEKRRADRRLREEQDAAYLAALRIDQEKERIENLSAQERAPKHVNTSHKLNHEKIRQSSMSKQHDKATASASTNKETPQRSDANRGKQAEVTQILIRFPNGERKEQSFLCTDKIQAIYGYIDSLGLVGVGNYRLISNFPRKVYGVDQMGMTLKDAGLHPKASLFLELL